MSTFHSHENLLLGVCKCVHGRPSSV